AGAELAHDLVRDGGALHGNLVHILLGGAFTLADGFGHFAGLADAVADVAFAVTHDDQRGELHDAAALDSLGDTVDGDDLGDHAVVLFTVSLHGHVRSLLYSFSPASRAPSASALTRPW